MNVSAPSAVLNTALTNNGVIDIQSGALTISGNYTQSAGTFRVDNAATLKLNTPAGSFTVNNLQLAGGATIAGADSVSPYFF